MEHIIGFETLLFELFSFSDTIRLIMKRNIFNQIHVVQEISRESSFRSINEMEKNVNIYYNNCQYVDFSLYELKHNPIVFHLFENMNDIDRNIYIRMNETCNIIISGYPGDANEPIFIVTHYFPSVVRCFINFQTHNYIFL